jgi:flavin reductase (DIM6/NTAB) family NADH-FMN oxidoreductase RutF
MVDLAFETWDTGCPILTDALANFECRTRATYDGGDSLIFLGEVIRMRSVAEGRPLLYFRGYSGLQPVDFPNQMTPI